jgi:hypothetical protein
MDQFEQHEELETMREANAVGVMGWCERCAEERLSDGNGNCPECGIFIAHVPVTDAEEHERLGAERREAKRRFVQDLLAAVRQMHDAAERMCALCGQRLGEESVSCSDGVNEPVRVCMDCAPER